MRRNPQPPVKERTIELLVYSIFVAFDGDKGEHATAWVELGDLLLSISRETVSAKLASFRDGLATALENALLEPAAAAPPAPAAPPAAAETTPRLPHRVYSTWCFSTPPERVSSA